MVQIEVEGMSCGGCVNSVSKIIHRTGGFAPEEIQVDLDSRLAEFPETDGEKLSEILARLTDAGFPSKRRES